MENTGSDRREFFRLNFTAPLQYKSYAGERSKAPSEKTEGTARNISQSGILFQTQQPPALSSILWLSLDIRTLKICQEIESRALILNNGLVGKVVRVEEDPQDANAYDVGVCFLTKSQKDSREVQEILSTMSQSA